MDTIKTSEADMGYVRDFVQKIAEALVAATELPNQIKLMQNDVDALHADLEKTKARNIELDTLTGDLRRQRDEAEQALSQAKADLSFKSDALNSLTSQTDGLKAQLEEFRARLEDAKRERDDYGLKHIEAEDRAKQAEAKLAKLAEALGMPKPEVAKPTPVEPVVKAPEPKPEVPKPWPSPTPVEVGASPTPASPTPSPSPSNPVPEKRVYEGEPGFNDLSHTTEQYDSQRYSYYRTA